MRHVGYYLKPKAVLVLSRADLTLLLRAARAHYDSSCRAAAEYGGLLYGWRNRMGDADEVEVEATSRELDRLCKITEVFTTVQSEWQRLQSLHYDLRQIGLATQQQRREIKINAERPDEGATGG